MKSNYLMGVALLFCVTCNSYANDRSTCKFTANLLKRSCHAEVQEDLFAGIATCVNITDRSDFRECVHEVRSDKRENLVECRKQRRARRDVCDLVGPAAYEPEFGEEFADNFVDPLEIGNSVAPNPYFPLVQGYRWTYEKTIEDDEGEEVTETIVVTVTDKTKEIQGVTCLTISDIATEDGQLIEDTADWYTQDVYGNIWYCGEVAQNFESFEADDPEEAELVDLEGSWKAGRDGAKAGILFPAMPVVGETLRQEVLWTDAEDVISIESLTGTESAPAASCNNDCLVTKDFSALEPGVIEFKFFAPGVGLIVETDPESDERLELIEFTMEAGN